MSFEVILDKEEVGTSVFMKDLDTGCQVSVLSFGALLNGFAIPVNGEYLNVIDGYYDNEDAQLNIETDFRCARLCPFVGNIKRGHFTFNGRDHKIEKLYAGLHAYNGLLYDLSYEIVETKKTIDKAELHLKSFYPGTDKGYPYKFLTDVIYRLQSGNKLTIETCVQHFLEHAIPFGEGWHIPIQLTAEPNEYFIKLPSNKIYRSGKNNDYKERETVASFQEFHPIEEEEFVFELDEREKTVLMKDDVLQLTMNTGNYPFLIVQPDRQRSAVALTCSTMLPDAFNHGKGLLILKPGKKYNFSCSFTLEETPK